MLFLQNLTIRFLAFICICWSCIACREPSTEKVPLLQQVSSAHSSVTFNNTLVEDEKFNIIEYLYFYNGGGVAIGDINNDRLPDLYFSSNQGLNKLYLNKGDLKFEDITAKAGVEGAGNWKTGVTMVDVNNDGFLDIYLCGVGNYKNFDGYNQLFINQGDLSFTEQSKEFGLNFQGFSTHSAFFDYDRDGDLDMYLLNHSVHSTRSYGKVSLRYQTDSLAGDRLYQNQLVETGKTFFKDVTAAAGIFSSQVGYGLGIGISDLNGDGWSDIYVSNDFHENDYLYINQQNGTFSQQAEKSLAHTSRFSMGNDIGDLNNDQWPDVITLDMLPREESVIKTSAGEDSYEVYKFKLSSGYGKQVSRNALQLNRGPIDSGRLVFSDIAQAAGIEATDWSWCPLIVDFDGDGHKDVFISNGIVRRPNDLDYINFISNDSVQKSSLTNGLKLADQMPPGKVSNFVFRNDGNLKFEDRTKDWGIDLPSFSNGAAYGDLDNDGDPDLVVNQINGEALIYRNTSTPGHFLKVQLNASNLNGNRNALGAKVKVEQNGLAQMQELNPSRGWCSSSDQSLLFGASSEDSVSVTVTWPDGKISQHKSKAGNITIDYTLAEQPQTTQPEQTTLLTQIDFAKFLHQEDEFNAFNRESLIPHMLSTEGPPMAVGDINGDRLDDVFIGGGKGQAGAIFTQKASGDWQRTRVTAIEKNALSENTDASFFDADGDGDQDLVVVSGGQEEMENRELLAPRLYLNDGRGNFTNSPDAFMNIFLHASCVKPFDYDRDGDVDIFMGASVMPFLYGMSPVSFLLQNNGSGVFNFDPSWLGQSTFDNMTRVRPGMVKDAVWTDVNKDDRADLVLVGEWMPITVLVQQADHRFLNMTNQLGLAKTSGWWNVCEAGDFDRDGDDDLMLGNLGLNSRIKASPQKPLTMYLGDFDSNQGSDHIIVYYNGENSYPFASRDQLTKQIPSLKKKFLHYRDYRDVKLEDIITPMQKGNSAIMSVEILTSVFLRNDSGRFTLVTLPAEAQYFPVFAIKSSDIDHDGNLDVLLTGNLSATQPDFGSYDGGVGLVMRGDGNGNFTPLAARTSGFVTLGEGRDIEVVKSSDGAVLYAVSRNNQSVLAFKENKPLQK